MMLPNFAGFSYTFRGGFRYACRISIIFGASLTNYEPLQRDARKTGPVKQVPKKMLERKRADW